MNTNNTSASESNSNRTNDYRSRSSEPPRFTPRGCETTAFTIVNQNLSDLLARRRAQSSNESSSISFSRNATDNTFPYYTQDTQLLSRETETSSSEEIMSGWPSLEENVNLGIQFEGGQYTNAVEHSTSTIRSTRDHIEHSGIPVFRQSRSIVEDTLESANNFASINEQEMLRLPPLPNGLTSVSFGYIVSDISFSGSSSLPRRTLFFNNRTIISETINSTNQNALEPQFEMNIPDVINSEIRHASTRLETLRVRLSPSGIGVLQDTLAHRPFNTPYIPSPVFSRHTSSVRELDAEAYQPFITVDGLEKDYFLNDPTMSEWNNLSYKEGDISDFDWEHVQIFLKSIFAITHPGKDPVYIRKFLINCMISKDASTPEGKQMVRKRVEAAVNSLKEMNVYRNLIHDEKEKETALIMLHEALNIVQEGGMKCSDRAIVFLIHLESYIKLLKNPDYLPNVMVQMFKIHSLMTLTNDSYGENIETFFRCLLELNAVLGLGQFKGSNMNHSPHAQEKPIEETLEILSKHFTLENLLNFTIEQTVFIKRFEAEMVKDPMVVAAREAYIEADNAETALAAEYAKDNFYKSQVTQLFRKAGFVQINQSANVSRDIDFSLRVIL